MLITITEPMERTEKEICNFLFHQVALGLPFEQVEDYFEVEDLPKIRKMWMEAEEEWDRIWSRPLYNKDDEDFMWWEKD